MPPKWDKGKDNTKKGGKKGNKGTDSGLPAQVETYIRTNFDALRKSSGIKETYWKSISNKHKPLADAFFDKLMNDFQNQQSAAAPVTGQASSSAVQTSAGESSGLGAVSASPVQPDIPTRSSNDTKGDAVGGGEAVDLVNTERTSREMPEQPMQTKIGKDGAKTTKVFVQLGATEGVSDNFSLNDWQFDCQQTLASLSDEATYPTRMYQRDAGMPVYTNRFEVTIDENATLHEFQITNIPEGRSRRMTKMFVDTALAKSVVLNNNRDWLAADDMGKIIAWKDLRADLAAQGSNATHANGWRLVDVKDGDDAVVTLRLRYTGQVDVEGLKRYVATSPPSDEWRPMQWPNETSTLEALNIVIAKYLDTGAIRTSANKFFIDNAWILLKDSPLCTIRGYFFSTRPGMGKILLNVNSCTSAFFRPIFLSELMASANVFGKDYPSMLEGLRVYIDYERGHPAEGELLDINTDESRIKKICELGKPCDEQTFRFRRRNRDSRTTKTADTGNDDKEAESSAAEGKGKGKAPAIEDNGKAPATDAKGKAPATEEKGKAPATEDRGKAPATQKKEEMEDISEEDITVASYLQQEYQITLTEPGLEAVNLGSRMKPSWFPPEKLKIMPYQIYRRAVPSALTSAMLTEACSKPDHNRGLIEGEGMNKVLLARSPKPPHLNNVPLSIEHRMLKTCGVKLAFPTIKYGNHGEGQVEHGAQWNLNGIQFLSTSSEGSTRKIPYVVLHDRGVTKDRIEPTLVNLEGQLAGRNVGTGDFKGYVELNLNQGYEQTFRNGLQDAQRHGNALVFLVLRNKSQEQYSTFKYLADKVFGMSSIVMLQSKWKSELDQYIGNVMMKVNLKMGGINHSAESSQGNIENWLSSTLVLGADVTHPSPGSLDGCPSVAALVGSVETTGGRFLGSLSLQEGKTEMITDLQTMVAARLQAWYENNNNTLPENILYYRDGVSDRQMAAVKETELKSIREAFKDFRSKHQTAGAPPQDLRLTAVVCTKRHHTRFYPINDKQHDNENCRPGTLVERTVTHPYFTDFYLQSHNGIKGTAKPAHYFVLVNEMAQVGFDISELQHLTYNLCLSYVRATMGVSYASPAYYADRLCERARCYLRKFFAPSHADRRELKHEKERFEGVYGIRPFPNFDEMSAAERNAFRDQVRVANEAIQRDLVAWTMGKARTRFAARGEETPVTRAKCAALLDTMYWM